MASSAATSPIVDSSIAKSSQTAPARKRRRRTAATGAAEDCFTCRKRSVKCDRRRPYCTQCLDIGKDCSGYRTTLTWGVGVASRGKLRGLSLPIVNSTQKAASANEETKDESSPPPKSATSQLKSPEQDIKPKVEDDYSGDHHHAAVLSPSVYSPSAYNPTSPIPIPAPHQQRGWHVPNFSERFDGYNNSMSRPTALNTRPNPMRRVHTTATASFDETVFSAPSACSLSTYSESDFPSPNDLPPTPESFSVVEPFIGSYTDSFACPQESTQAFGGFCYTEAPQSFAMPSYAGPTMSPRGDASAYTSMIPNGSAPTTFSDLLHCNELMSIGGMDAHFSMPPKADQEYYSDGFSDFSVSSPLTWATSHQPTNNKSGLDHIPSRLRLLLEYYDTALSPTLVAFDNPANPYRLYVMELASSSPALQQGLAALVLNNIRHKGLKVTKSNMPSQLLLSLDALHLSPQHDSEEAQFQASCTQLFNLSLQDPAQASSDAVLATLLIQCLLHLSDGGFSKFRTQLAGVRRLIELRPHQNAFSSWARAWFTWFDLMSSTVGDRDSQTRTELLDSLDLSANIGCLEHLAACDGRLFKLIARLAHLNVTTPTRPKQEFFATPPTPQTMPSTPKAHDFYAMTNSGWASGLATPKTPTAPTGDAREEIWTQFLQVRTRLSSWVSHPKYQAASQLPASDAEKQSTHHISELYKAAAALYTERLVSPSSPATAESIQTHVRTGLRNLASLPAEAHTFLLWPILVIGSECVFSNDRYTLRQALPSAGPSFLYRQWTAMDVLETVWQHHDANYQAGMPFYEQTGTWPLLNSLGGQASHWHHAMREMDKWTC